MTRLDVLVVGGGPAGAGIATLVARAGARVAVLEREAFPRDKVCGEFLSPEGVAVLGRLGVLGQILAHGPARMDACMLSDRRGRSLEAPLPDLPGAGREALGISRAVMDATILEAAARCGAEVRERVEVVAPLLENGRVVGVRARAVGASADGEQLRARLVVAADGRRSTLQRALAPGAGDPLRSGPRSWFGLKVHLDGDAARVGRRIELHLYDGGYAGLGTIEGGRLNLCFLARVDAMRACGGSPERLLRERLFANALLRSRLDGARPSGAWKTVGPLRFGVRRPAIAGALLVGDAAGTIDPFSGEGMSNALVGAELALPWVLAAVSAGALTAELASGWERTFRGAFSGVTRRVRVLGHLFERPGIGEPALKVLGAAGPSRVLARLVAGTRTGVPGPPGTPRPHPA